MELVDSHCHIDFKEFDEDRDQVIRRCKSLGIKTMIVPGVQASTWPQLLVMCNRYDGLYPTLGIHPYFLDQYDEGDLDRLEATLADRQGEVVAVGEIGMDYQLKELDKQKQQYVFNAQLAIARDADLPVILHVRKAHELVLHSLKEFRIQGGIVHAFNGSLDQAKKYQAYGFKFGFGGMLTYERSTKLRALAQALPLDAIVLETDAPNMCGQAHRGERNNPEYLLENLEVLASLRDESKEEIAKATLRNTKELFGLD